MNPFTTGIDIAQSDEVLRHWMPRDLSLLYGFKRLQMDVPIRAQAPDISDGHMLCFGSFKNRIPMRWPSSSSSDSQMIQEESLSQRNLRARPQETVLAAALVQMAQVHLRAKRRWGSSSG